MHFCFQGLPFRFQSLGFGEGEMGEGGGVVFLFWMAESYNINMYCFLHHWAIRLHLIRLRLRRLLLHHWGIRLLRLLRHHSIRALFRKSNKSLGLL